MSFGALFNIFLHAFAAWLLIEIFVNLCHGLPRRPYVALHYLVVVGAYAASFFVHFRFFGTGASVFATTLTAMSATLVLELLVFRYVYLGERWFLNFVDWIVPAFLATSTVYAVGFLYG